MDDNNKKEDKLNVFSFFDPDILVSELIQKKKMPDKFSSLFSPVLKFWALILVILVLVLFVNGFQKPFNWFLNQWKYILIAIVIYILFSIFKKLFTKTS